MFAFLLGVIPGLSTAATAITTAIFNAKVKMVTARVGGDRDVAIKLVTAAATQEHENTSKLAIMASNPLLVFLLVGFAFPLVLYVWKIVVVDIIIGPGCIWFTNACWIANTDPIRGGVADWATTIIGFLFGSTTALAAGKMYFGRDKTGE